MMKRKIGALALLALMVATWLGYPKSDNLLKQQIGQKIILDIRYFCPDMDEDADSDDCKTPVTHLPDILADTIRDTNLGGIILFAENLETPRQIIRLTTDLQQAARGSSSGLPLFISIDQEGGNVVRLPNEYSTTFSGNMAVGATYAQHGDKFARLVGSTLGRELRTLGINVNHAPSVDVNSNPDNPVINVRAFSDRPETVAQLGAAMLEGMQQEGIIGTIKHFPGHGDTRVDSHSGLPVVTHDKARIMSTDIEPFRRVLQQTNVQMVMTAHIQFPQLDSSTVVNKYGQAIVRPATLSREILTGVLRNKLGFEGLIISDALDMDGIANFFTPVEAVINTFEAGTDIALMPIQIRKPADIKSFRNLLDYVSKRMIEEPEAYAQVARSYQRIATVKEQLRSSIPDVDSKLASAEEILASAGHRAIEQALAQASIVEWNSGDRPDLSRVNRVHVVFPREEDAAYLAQQLAQRTRWQVTSDSLRNATSGENPYSGAAIAQADLVIVGNNYQQLNSPALNRDTAPAVPLNRADRAARLLKLAGDKGKTRVYVSLGSPYSIDNFIGLSDIQIFTFNEVSYHLGALRQSPTLEAVANVVSGRVAAEGQLPVNPLHSQLVEVPGGQPPGIRAAQP